MKARKQEASQRSGSHYCNGKTDHDYLLTGLDKCAVYGYACTGHTTTAQGKKHHYYTCIDGRT